MSTSETLRIVFFGTSEFSVAVLDELKRGGMTPALIVTMPDAPKGRGQTLTPPPAKCWAEREHVAVLQPKTLRDDAAVAPLLNTQWDLFIVASYGHILPPDVLAIPTYGVLNVHPSLLPKLRGASPVRSAILHDMPETGVTIMQMDEELDHGPALAQARIEIEPADWPLPARTLEAILARAGGELLVETIPAWIAGDITPEPQAHDEATYSEKITKDMGEISLADDPWQNLLKIRAYDGWPGTYFFHEKDGRHMRVKIADAEIGADGSLVITRVIPEGKREMPYEDFMRGN